MGLDMYFSMRKHTVEAEWHPGVICDYDKDLEVLEKKIAERNFKAITSEYDVGYFRKFNALHSYIIKNFADGVDNCQPILLGKGDCEEILAALKAVNKDNAAETMPTQSGFFFGGLEYDDYYFEDVKDAIELFTDILEVLNKDTNYKWQVIYCASW